MLKIIKVLHPGISSSDSIAPNNPHYLEVLVQADWVEYDARGKWEMSKQFIVQLEQMALMGDGAYWYDADTDPNLDHPFSWQEVKKMERKKYKVKDGKCLNKIRRDKLK